MSEDRALEVLGLAAVTSDQDLKRAYLRQVKQHPPERDADRFREVREAYEILQRGARVRRLVDAAPIKRQTNAPAIHEPADATAADEPGPQFPEHVAKQIDSLNEALAGDDPVGAAQAMIALYARPLLEEAPAPPPIFALKTFMVLMERGCFRQARSLLQAFESHAQKHRDGSDTRPDVAARWKLAREVLACSELDEELASAVAAGLRHGQLYTASDAAEAAFHRHGAQLEPHMRAKSPTLWASIAPLIRSAQRDVSNVRPGFGGGFKLGGWPLSIVAIVGFNIVRLLASGSSTNAVPAEPPRIERPSSPTGSDSPDVVPRDVDAARERQLDRSWASVEQAVNIGDCQTVREQWPLYRAAKGTSSHIDREVEASRVARALEMCPELKDVVEPAP